MSFNGPFDHAAAVEAAQKRLAELRQQRLNSALYGLVEPADARADIEHGNLGLALRERALENFCRDAHRPDSLLAIKDPEDRALLLEAGNPRRAAA